MGSAFVQSVFRFLPPIILLPSVCLALLSCGEDRPHAFEPAPSEPTFPVQIASSLNLTSIESDAKTPTFAQARVRCETCHARVDVGEPATSTSGLEKFHQGLAFRHGDLECASCHVPGQALELHLATGETLPMVDALRLCSQCHGPKRRAFDDGSHGGMNGHWDLSRGPRLRNQCVHCHDPHAPQIAPVAPVFPPRDRGELPKVSPREGVH